MDGDLLALYRLGAGPCSQDLLLEAHRSLLLRRSSVSSLWAAAFVLRIATGVWPRDENGTDIFRPYSKPNPFRRVEICPYSSPDIQHPTSDTVSVSEYSNRIFMMSISNRILSDIVDTIRIRIRTADPLSSLPIRVGEQ